jgi:hypothetical protein
VVARYPCSPKQAAAACKIDSSRKACLLPLAAVFFRAMLCAYWIRRRRASVLSDLFHILFIFASSILPSYSGSIDSVIDDEPRAGLFSPRKKPRSEAGPLVAQT